ncbi:hypothetical protein C1N71_01305 [Agrococcus sp. SGAir0287]|nr:hypothetical protein C1N71_01305 [Agrococcus sp. SGAir0287]
MLALARALLDQLEGSRPSQLVEEAAAAGCSRHETRVTASTLIGQTPPRTTGPGTRARLRVARSSTSRWGSANVG